MWTIYFIGMFIYLNTIPRRVYNYSEHDEIKVAMTILWTICAAVWPLVLIILSLLVLSISFLSSLIYIFVPDFRKDIISFYIDIFEEVKSFLVIKDEKE